MRKAKSDEELMNDLAATFEQRDPTPPAVTKAAKDAIKQNPKGGKKR